MIDDETNTKNLDDVLPPNERNLTVKIVGLALFQLEDNQWKISFPAADNTHVFKIVINKFDANGEEFTSEFILPVGCNIDFIPNNKGENSQGHNSLSEIISFAGLHNTRLISLSTEPKKYAGKLKMNGTTLFGEVFAQQTDYSVWKVEKISDIEFRRTRIIETQPLGNNLSAGFKVDENDLTQIKVSGGLNYEINLPYLENSSPVSYEIIFYNDCGNMPECRNLGDLHYYYEILQTGNITFEFVRESGNKTKNGGCTPACNC
jgi:hypothetical protein